MSRRRNVPQPKYVEEDSDDSFTEEIAGTLRRIEYNQDTILDFFAPGMTPGFFMFYMTVVATLEMPNFPTTIFVAGYLYTMFVKGRIQIDFGNPYVLRAFLIYAFTYIVMGICWIPIRYHAYVRQDDITNIIVSMVNGTNNDSAISEFVVSQFPMFVRWVIYWPFSIPLTFYNVYIYNHVAVIFTKMINILARMTNRRVYEIA